VFPNSFAAPGFQTSVKRIRVTPEIAARIRRGEEVSPEEIEAASRKAEEEEEESSAVGVSPAAALGRGVMEERDDRYLIASERRGEERKEEVNEWLPESVTKPARRKKGRR